ncbi:hypothetical protein COOONC_26293 [Cooperia oncophora]
MKLKTKSYNLRMEHRNACGQVHWLKVDFDKWKDEDDSGAEDGMPFGGSGAGGFDLNSYMNQMGGGGKLCTL